MRLAVHLLRRNPAPVYGCVCVLCSRTAEAKLATWLKRLQSGWRIARSQASNVGAAALALTLAVGLSSAIFTVGGWRPMLDVAPDSPLDQMTTPPRDSIVAEAREIPVARVARLTRPRNHEANFRRPIAGRAPGRNVIRQSTRSGRRFMVSTLLRLLRHRNHLVISELLGSDGEYSQ